MDVVTSVSAVNSKHLDVLKKNISLNKFELHELSRNNGTFELTQKNSSQQFENLTTKPSSKSQVITLSMPLSI